MDAVDAADEMHAGGTVAYRVTLDGEFVGWVGDGRPFPPGPVIALSWPRTSSAEVEAAG
ncbi:hypothetical protein GCM10009676_14470 [Prauserella halophila]|uniref:Uncharacterized protein n=1 Tax=Prauserella halophila TaxID=185641 RepID=A0ABN1W2F8_9PSEU|nr:hypothetical protein [Prauserella halophila]